MNVGAVTDVLERAEATRQRMEMESQQLLARELAESEDTITMLMEQVAHEQQEKRKPVERMFSGRGLIAAAPSHPHG